MTTIPHDRIKFILWFFISLGIFCIKFFLKRDKEYAPCHNLKTQWLKTLSIAINWLSMINSSNIFLSHLKFQSTNDLNSSLYFKYVDTDYESLNDVDVQERMSTSMLLIKMRGTGCTDILRKSRQSYMSISIPYSCCGF